MIPPNDAAEQLPICLTCHTGCQVVVFIHPADLAPLDRLINVLKPAGWALSLTGLLGRGQPMAGSTPGVGLPDRHYTIVCPDCAAAIAAGKQPKPKKAPRRMRRRGRQGKGKGRSQ